MINETAENALQKSAKEASEYKHALEAQQALFASIVNSSDDAILSKTLDGVVTSWNHGAEKVFGYTAKEIIGKPISILIPPHLQNEEKEIIKKISKGEFVNHYETERIRRDGKVIYVSLTISPVKDESGNIVGASKISRDITERKSAEEKIIKSRRLYAFLSQINQSIVQIKNEKELFRTACKIGEDFGQFKMTWIGMLDQKGLLNIVSIKCDPALIQVMMQFSGKDYNTAALRNTPSGKVLHTGKHVVNNDMQNDPAMSSFKDILLQHGIKATVSFPLKKYGKVVGVLGFHSGSQNFFDEDEIKLLDEAASDISFALENYENEKQQRKWQEHVLQNEARLKEAQALGRIGNFEVNLSDRSALWSDELYDMYGVKKDEVQASPELFLSFMHPEDAEFAQKEVQKVFETSQPTSFDFRFIRKDGTIRHGHSEARFEFDKDNKPIRLYGIVQDITETKLAEQERERITSDLLQRNKDLEQFTYIVSHNLRAPVANIMGTSEALRTMKLNEDEKEEMMHSLSASVMKLNGVILDLNNIIQIKRNVSEKRETVSFSHLIKNIIISIDDQIKKEHVEIKTDFSEIDKMETLKSYLYSVFYNLISNSIKYKQPDMPPLIEIKSFKRDDKIEIHFKDNGLGIDMQKKGDLVFGLYKRFHTHKEGKGMGLFMVKTQVETLGGKISVESEVNKGTKFIISFPS